MKFTNFIPVILLLMLVVSGCSKKISTSANVSPVTDSAGAGEMIRTPFGLMDKSNVHFVDSGYQLSYAGDHLVKIYAKTGKVAEDFGVQKPIENKKRNVISTGGNGRNGTVVPGLGQGWITYAQNNVTVPATGFNTQWTVPFAPPVYQGGALLYLFDGMQDGMSATSHILQPVLQYGSNGAFGGDYWVIDNWYASCQTCQAFYASPVIVPTGTILVGDMHGAAAASGGGYNYTSRFYSILSNPPGSIAFYPTSNTLTVNNVAQMLYLFETMETYGMQQYANYPADNVCKMTNINVFVPGSIPTRPTYITPNWIPYNIVTDVGQHTIIVSPREVDLYFH